MKARQKEILRSVKQSKMRFFYMMAIIALGVSFFVGLKGVSPSMKRTAALYFKETNLADLHILSELGFDQDDIKRLMDVPGAARAEGAYSLDVVTRIGEESYTTHILSYNGEGELNAPVLLEGRLPERADECAVQNSSGIYQFAKIGDTIEVTDESQSEEMLKNLKTKRFTVVGYTDDPLYITHDLGSTNIGSGKIDNYMIVPESAFSFERFTDAWILSKATEDGVSPFSETYSEDIETLESLEEKAEENNISLFIKDIEKEYEDGKSELDAAKSEFSEQMRDAESQLRQAQEQLLEAKRQLDESEKQLSEGQAEIDENRKKLEDASATLTAGADTLKSQKEQLIEAKKQLSEGQGQLQAGFDALSAGYQAYEEQKIQAQAGIAQLQAGIEQIEEAILPYQKASDELTAVDRELQSDPENPELLMKKAVLTETLKQIEEALSAQGMSIETLTAQRNALEAQIEAIDQALTDGKAELDANQNVLEAKQKELDQAERELLSGEASLNAGERDIQANQKILDDSFAQLTAGQIELDDGRRAYQEGLREYQNGLSQYEENVSQLESSRIEAETEFSKAEADLQEAEEQIEELKDSKFYVYNRDDQVGYTDFNENANRIAKIANAFPLFFLAVSMLVVFATMTRMVEEERTEIGTLCALGYTKGQILMKYALYAGSAALIGSLIGTVFGMYFFPWFIYNAYMVMYHMPDVVFAFDWPVIVAAFIIAQLSTVGAASLVALYEMRSMPAELMRPKAPKPGKRVFLERIPLIWNRLSFIGKVSARNVLRYKARFFMTVLGIAGCTALLLTGFGIHDAIFTIIPNQFEKLQVYDEMIVLESGQTREDLQDLITVLNGDERIDEAEAVRQEQGKASFGTGSKQLSVYLITPSDTEHFTDFIQLSDRKNPDRPVQLSDDGAVVSERTAQILGAKVGDTLDVRVDDQPYSIQITDITENYLENYLYLTPRAYERMTGEAPLYNTLFANLTPEGLSDEGTLMEDLMKNPEILTVQSMSGISQTANDSIESLNVIVIVIVLFSGILAFIVLFNLTNINISERIREIATLKVLGFYQKETTHYVFRENIILSIVGLIIGLGAGVILLNYIISTVETDMMMFGREIFPMSYFYAAALTIVFAMVVNWAMTPAINRIDMVEALKSIE